MNCPRCDTPNSTIGNSIVAFYVCNKCSLTTGNGLLQVPIRHIPIYSFWTGKYYVAIQDTYTNVFLKTIRPANAKPITDFLTTIPMRVSVKITEEKLESLLLLL